MTAVLPEPSSAAVELDVVAEVICRTRPGLSRTTVAACVRQAFEDLAGSVSPESLPEMAARLAEHRLSKAVLDGRSLAELSGVRPR